MDGINFITPMDRINTMPPIRGISAFDGGTAEAQGISEAASPFKAIFQNAIEDVKQTEQQTALDSEQLVTGSIDDLHTLGIDSTKAYLSVRMLVEIRNKALDAYNELMRTNI